MGGWGDDGVCGMGGAGEVRWWGSDTSTDRKTNLFKI